MAGDATVQRFAPAALAATEYRERFGWSVVHRDGDLMLSLGNGVVGVAVPATHAHHVLAALQRQGLRGPVIGLQAVSFAWVFLAERNGMVVAQEDLPPRVKVLDCPSQVPLPSAHAASRRAAWIVAPDIRHRWLPILATVIAAARDAIRA